MTHDNAKVLADANELMEEIMMHAAEMDCCVNTICMALAFVVLQLAHDDKVVEANADDSNVGVPITVDAMLDVINDIAKNAKLAKEVN